jgi:hypothetical protein
MRQDVKDYILNILSLIIKVQSEKILDCASSRIREDVQFDIFSDCASFRIRENVHRAS